MTDLKTCPPRVSPFFSLKTPTGRVGSFWLKIVGRDWGAFGRLAGEKTSRDPGLKILYFEDHIETNVRQESPRL